VEKKESRFFFWWEFEFRVLVHQPLPPPPPGEEMIVDPCSNHLLIDTRSKADFDRSHAWTAAEVRAFFIPVKFLTQKSICAEDKRSSVIRKASHHWLLV
jgi:hypothetical protein